MRFDVGEPFTPVAVIVVTPGVGKRVPLADSVVCLFV